MFRKKINFNLWNWPYSNRDSFRRFRGDSEFPSEKFSETKGDLIRGSAKFPRHNWNFKSLCKLCSRCGWFINHPPCGTNSETLGNTLAQISSRLDKDCSRFCPIQCSMKLSRVSGQLSGNPWADAHYSGLPKFVRGEWQIPDVWATDPVYLANSGPRSLSRFGGHISFRKIYEVQYFISF